MTKTVDQYVSGLKGWQADVGRQLRKIILGAAPELRESIKWAEPVYESNGPVCHFKAHKNHVTFGFWRGAELRKLSERLESSGSKMAHIKITSANDVLPRDFAALVTAAVELNRSKGDPTKG